MGRLDEEVPLLIRATCDSPVRKKPGRREYQRGHLRRGTDGRYRVSTSAGQGSGMLHATATANCFVVLAAEKRIPRGLAPKWRCSRFPPSSEQARSRLAPVAGLVVYGRP
ncbi:MAG: hypothetical protein U5R48_14290 [Gammaproteobacteria bacterium]|nr:hypothetical protein [Gammaproteobacteria bacterium]